jgi:hypothetical protein
MNKNDLIERIKQEELKNPTELANTANLDLDLGHSIRYKSIPKEIYKTSIEEASKIVADKYNLDIFILDGQKEIVFSKLNQYKLDDDPKKSAEKKADEIIKTLDYHLKEILYDKLDALGGFRKFNRSFISYTDRVEENIIILNY